MTLGIIVGIIVLIVFVLRMADLKQIKDTLAATLVGLLPAILIGFIVSVLGGAIVQLVFYKDPYNVVSEQRIEIVGASISASGKSVTPTLVYTDSDMQTHAIVMTNSHVVETVWLANDDCEPYIIKKKCELKCHFISHIYDTTIYEYHGKVIDLYNE